MAQTLAPRAFFRYSGQKGRQHMSQSVIMLVVIAMVVMFLLLKTIFRVCKYDLLSDKIVHPDITIHPCVTV